LFRFKTLWSRRKPLFANRLFDEKAKYLV